MTSQLNGATVADLLDQATERLYDIAVDAPGPAALLAAWPAYQRACGLLLSAAVGPRITALPVTAGAQAADTPLLAGLRLHAHLTSRRPPSWPGVPDPTLTRAARLIGAAADLIQCAHDRPGLAGRDTVQTDAARTAGITAAAELVLTGADLTIRACGRPPADSSARPRLLTSRAAPLFDVRRAADHVMASSTGRADTAPLGAVHARTHRPETHLLGRLENAIDTWTAASLRAADRPAGSSAELQRSTVEARHLIALAAALTAATHPGGLDDPPRDADAILQHTGAAWSATTTAWIRFTTGVGPSADHVSASLELQSAVRAITRNDDGRWVSPEQLVRRVDHGPALELAHRGLRGVADVGHAHAGNVERLIRLGRLYAPARSLPATSQRLEARLQGRHAVVDGSEARELKHAYRSAATTSQVAALQVPDSAGRVAARSPAAEAKLKGLTIG